MGVIEQLLGCCHDSLSKLPASWFRQVDIEIGLEIFEAEE